jgi:hypothetical protein
MIRVVIESPFAGDVEKNLVYARRCMADSLQRGEAPYASHLLFTQDGILDDTIPEERELGIKAGFIWGEMAEKVVVYQDLGMSKGMELGVEEARRRGTPIEYRNIS